MPAATRRPSGSECIHGLVDLRNVAGMGAQRGAADQECFTGERGDVSSGSFGLGRGRVFFAGVHGRSRPKVFHGPLRAQILMMFRAVRYFPIILCCWVFVLKRQRPASPSFPPAAFSPSFRLPSSPLPPHVLIVIIVIILVIIVSAHPSHVSWPHREVHRTPQWLRPHATTAPISAHPSHVS